MRDAKEYQTVFEGKSIPVAEAPREHLEQELMRAYDMLSHFEQMLLPLTRMADLFISGSDKELDKMLAAVETE